MASRGAFGFRSGRQTEKEDKKSKTPALSRTPSLTSNTPSTSKPVSHSTSFFSRNKHSKSKGDVSSTASNIPGIAGQHALGVSSARTNTGASSDAGSAMSLGGVSTGKTTIQSKAGKPRHVLRRKAPSIEQHGAYARTESSASSYEPTPSRQYLGSKSSPGGYTDTGPRSILGVTAPPTSSSSVAKIPRGLGLGAEFATSSSHMASYNSRNNMPPSSTPTFPPPTPTYAQDSGSSTRRSESPSAFSRTSTPTSMSSQSPGVPTPAKAPVRARPTSPSRSRPPVTRNRFAERLIHHEDNGISRNTGLTAVRESATSSSSSSTLKPESRTGTSRAAYADRSSPQAGNLPTRTSSKKESTSQSQSQPQGFPQRKGSLNYGLEQRQMNAKRLAESPLEPDAEPPRSRTAPPRPSRDGVPQLNVALASPTDHTPRLQPSALASDGKSRDSFDTDRPEPEIRLGSSRSLKHGLGRSPSDVTSVQPSRMPSPNLLASRQATQTSPFYSRPSPSLETSLISVKSSKDLSPQSAGSAKSSSRFGFFSRRAKHPPETPLSEQAEKTAKKGPAAGTGHEGYGKYALRGRSGSATTSASRGRSTSSTSIGRTPSSRKSSLTRSDEPELDEFYRDRLAPRAITGGGRNVESANDVYMSESAQGSNNTLDSIARTIPASQIRPLRTEVSAQEPAHKLHHVNRRLPQREGDPSKPVLNQPYQPSGTPSLATRRSLHRSQLLQDAEPVRIPAPIDTAKSAAAPLTSRDTFLSSVSPTHGASGTDDISEGHEGNWLKAKRSGKPKKSPRQWNFFQRARGSPKRPAVPTAPRSDDDYSAVQALSTKVAGVTETRQVPFYALMNNSEQDPYDQMSSGQLTRTTSETDNQSIYSRFQSRDHSPAREQRKESMLLPSPPTLTMEFAKQANLQRSPEPEAPSRVSLEKPEPTSISEPRKPRLQQVGRIPRVVSKRDHVHRPAPQSFSRPRPVTPREDPVPHSAPPVVEAGTLPEPERPVLGVQTEALPQRPWGSLDSGKPASAPVKSSETSEHANQADEFLAFPPRIGSEVSGSSSSGILSFAAATTAVVPGPGAAPNDDEIWNEYNEFLDTVQTPTPLRNERTNPMEKTAQQIRMQPAPLHVRRDSSVTGSRSGSPVKEHASTYPPASAPPNKDLPMPPKRGKLFDAQPPTPGTISDLLASYDRNSTASKHRSRSTTSRYSTSSIESEADSLAGREAQGLQPGFCAPQTAAASRLSQIYLRRDALLASRWLSFDRVLFSPAHFEIQTNSKNNVLILDGLGNDEWSFYCAENYPKTQVFNLSSSFRNDVAPTASIPGVSPPQNHQQRRYLGLDRPFPFAGDTFSTAVFRFPAATSDANYYNAISELKRVLRPGGYLEISLLDIDLVNMGNLARKALRGLKERKHTQDPEVSLKPVSDNIQKMLGKKGFENLNRCTLDVPVAGFVNNSRAESFDEASGKELPPKRNSARASGSIAKNLSKVGRWWFTSCYESGLQGTMWNDKALLAECEARETGFKLLLCYAQKPINKRRTRSF
ncbi:uncharacterized protein KY384_008217 [Bacidia gigantensis]|uniref:uncharacterized protein n=1 Tax=Bacidia gigantensis TaxID=2732470 RepID=UPI001D043F89|nr:uncharacterized protein KY384_008217 [Bacidia gigantensis]KAG8526788.1 hypothetical protein KY384_008217 [Bacidia gigantensis]